MSEDGYSVEERKTAAGLMLKRWKDRSHNGGKVMSTWVIIVRAPDHLPAGTACEAAPAWVQEYMRQKGK